MGDIFIWNRIEPHTTSTDVEVGLAAEVADPLWLLGRQFQFGELAGDDGGTPVAVDVHLSWSRFTRYQLGSDAPEPLPADVPVEALVESEPVLDPDATDEAAGSWAVRVRAGRLLDRRLRRVELDEVADRLATHADTTFPPDPSVGPRGEVDRRYAALLPGRAIDGLRLLRRQRAGAGLPSAVLIGLDAGDRARAAVAVDAWAAEVAARWHVGAGAARSWVPDRLEYTFALAAPPLPGAGEPEIVLRAASGLQFDIGTVRQAP